jgi:serine/threonine protein kinase
MAAGVSSGSVVPANARNFGKYQLVVRLATGGMAEIFLARLKAIAGFEKFVVIKRILPHLDEDEQFVAMFLDEARIAARITHANVCQVYELGEVDGQYFLAMEYLEGITLNSAMRKLARERQPADARFVVGLMAQAAEGLHYAHELRDLNGPLGIVHRDVSPQNLFITVDGLAKVLDFGIAKAQGASSRTRTGTVKGKYAYMPPEQLRGDPLDRRVDVWALGVVLFEALTGKRLFWRDTDFLIFRAITDEAIPHVRDYRPDVPAALDAAVARALSRNRDDRFPSARAFGEAIAQSVGSLGGAYSQAALSGEVMRLFAEEIEQHRALVAEATRIPDEESTSKVNLRASSSPITEPPTQQISASDPIVRGRSKPGLLAQRSGSIDADTTSDDAPPTVAQSPNSLPQRQRQSTSGASNSTSAERPAGRAMLPLPAPDRDASRVAAPSFEDAAVPVAASVPSGSSMASAPSLTSGTALVNPVGEQSYSYEASLLRPRRGGVVLWIFGIVVVAIVALVIGLKNGDNSSPSSPSSSATPAAVGTDRTSAPVTGPMPNPTIVTPPVPVAAAAPDAAPAAVVPPPPPNDKPPLERPAVDAATDEPDIVIGTPTPRDKPRTPRPKVARPPRDRDPEPREPKEPPKEPASDLPGWVSIDSDPYATIFIDGKKIGVTPLARIPLPAGTHRVKAVSSQGGEQMFNVSIESGKEAHGKKLGW